MGTLYHVIIDGVKYRLGGGSGGGADLSDYYTKDDVDGLVGDIESALDEIIALQDSIVGGEEA